MSGQSTWWLVGLTSVMCALVATAQIPTREARIESSGLNPELRTWRTPEVGIAPSPKSEAADMTACYRYAFDVPADVRRASFCVTGCSRAWVFVNGKEIARPKPGRGVALLAFDLGEHLRPGRNVVAVRQPANRRRGSKLAADGIVFCRDGSVVRLQTDASWQVGVDLPEGFETSPAGLPLESVYLHRGGAPAVMTYTPPYYGRLQVEPAGDKAGRNGAEQPIFDEEDPVELRLTVMNARGGGEGDGAVMALSYSIMDEERRETKGQGTVDLDPANDLDLAGALRFGPMRKGAYRVRFELTRAGELLESRNVEVVCVGPIAQREVAGDTYTDGMDLDEIWTVDCTAEPEPGTYITYDGVNDASLTNVTVETRVVEGPAGRYRELVGESSRLSIGYRYKHRRLYAPHLAVVEWPDDEPRSFGVFVVESCSTSQRGYFGYQRGDASFVSSEDHPRLTNRMRKLHVLYWPNEEEAAVHIWHYGGRTPTAVARITVYEIANGLPALRIRGGGDRMIGFHSERGPWTMASTYYAGPMGAAFWFHGRGAMDHPEFYRNWYTTTENMIKFMRFSGQNLYVMGQFMYSSYLYPSKKFHFNQNNYAGGAVSRDYGGLILRMFERNGMSMVSSIEFVSSPDLLAAYPASPEEIRQGAPTILCISRTGEMTDVSRGRKNLWSRMDIPALNYLHPAVQEKLLAIVDELVDLYAGYPAWKGINLVLSRQIGGPIQVAGWGRFSRHMKEDNPLDWGYEDYTVSLFEQDTGIEVPVANNDPERFGKRCDWIMAHARDAWVDWRCEQYAAIYKRVRDRLVEARSDLMLYLSCMEPDVKNSRVKQCRDMDGHYQDQEALQRIIREFGFDPLRLKQEPGLVQGYVYSGRVPLQHRAAHELLRSEPWNELWAGDGKHGAYVWVGLTHHGRFRFKKDNWLFRLSSTRQAYAWPRHPREAFVNVMVRSNPVWMPHTWMDVVESTGRLHELRVFSRAYRSVPNGDYERLTGNGRDKNVWIASLKKDKSEVLMVANTHWWDLDVTLNFAPGIHVHDLIHDRPAALDNGAIVLDLGPYDIRTFRVDGTADTETASLLGAEAVSAEAEESVRAKEERLQQVVLVAHERAEGIQSRPGWAGVAPLEARLERLRRLMQEERWAAAADVAFSWETRRQRDKVVYEALEAIPFLAIGPFGKLEDTNVAKFGMHNPEVMPDYRGMETPFLDESDVQDCVRLKDGFRPSGSATYTVYPGASRGWQDALKTYHLCFEGICESPAPYWMVAYAYTEVFSPDDRDVLLWAGNDHAIWIYLNDERVLNHGGHGTHRQGQSPSSPRKHRVACELQKGWNRFLIKTIQRGACRVYFSLTDTDENPLEDLRYRVPAV